MKQIIVIPTLNERGNVSKISRRIFSILKKTEILFIDDNSNDGTKEEILNLSKKNKKIKYIFRKEKFGIGSAHKEGLNYGKKKNYNILITMDCDGTHDPKYIPKMLKKIPKFDIVNTNRFNKKNALKNWSIVRKFITSTRHFLIKNLLNLHFDSSGGFRLYNIKKIRTDDIKAAKHNGYSFLWESLYIFKRKNYKIFEINVILPRRNLGFSKMKFSDIIEGLFYLIKIFVAWNLLK